MDQKKGPVSVLDMKIRHFIQLRWASRVAVILATATSVWANWLHSAKEPWPIAINILPPLIVLAGFEFTAHVPAWEGPWWHPRRWVRPSAMVGITGIGAWLSYWHQKAAFLTYSRDAQTALLLPLAIDGLMIIASVAVLDLNVRIGQLTAYKEAGGISTYIPPASKPKPKDGDQKKEKIAEVLKRFPEYSIQDVAKAAGTSLNYVYTVGRALNDPRFAKPQRQRHRNNDTQPAAATAA
jgi:hypothetical protein